MSGSPRPSEQLGDYKPAAVRSAGVYAMAGLADDWEANRQTCVDVLCAYLRMPYEPDPGRGCPRRRTACLPGQAAKSVTLLSASSPRTFKGRRSGVLAGPELRLHWRCLRRRQIHRGVLLRVGSYYSPTRCFLVARSTSVLRSSPVAQSCSAPPDLSAVGSTSTPSSPVAGSASPVPGSAVAKSASKPPSSPAAGSTFLAPSSLAAASTSATPTASFNISGASFSGGIVDFGHPGDWSCTARIPLDRHSAAERETPGHRRESQLASA